MWGNPATNGEYSRGKTARWKMSMRTFTSITAKVRLDVYDRDSIQGTPCCIYCGSPYHIEIAHYIERSRGGMGIPQNLVCLCTECHRKQHNGDKDIEDFMRKYLMCLYDTWSESDLIYDKWGAK